ncbi:hypothetical protein HUJ05_012221, partial [Dendroctonus ponderosae]
VLATLRFFETGSYQEVTISNSFVGISQASVSRAITKVSNALNEAPIENRIIKYQQTIADLEALRTSFYEKRGMPGIVPIAIMVPHNNDPNFPEHVYVNRKNYHSIKVQFVSKRT